MFFSPLEQFEILYVLTPKSGCLMFDVNVSYEIFEYIDPLLKKIITMNENEQVLVHDGMQNIDFDTIIELSNMISSYVFIDYENIVFDIFYTLLSKYNFPNILKICVLLDDYLKTQFYNNLPKELQENLEFTYELWGFLDTLHSVSSDMSDEIGEKLYLSMLSKAISTEPAVMDLIVLYLDTCILPQYSLYFENNSEALEDLLCFIFYYFSGELINALMVVGDFETLIIENTVTLAFSENPLESVSKDHEENICKVENICKMVANDEGKVCKKKELGPLAVYFEDIETNAIYLIGYNLSDEDLEIIADLVFQNIYPTTDLINSIDSEALLLNESNDVNVIESVFDDSDLEILVEFLNTSDFQTFFNNTVIDFFDLMHINSNNLVASLQDFNMIYLDEYLIISSNLLSFLNISVRGLEYLNSNNIFQLVCNTIGYAFSNKPELFHLYSNMLYYLKYLIIAILHPLFSLLGTISTNILFTLIILNILIICMFVFFSLQFFLVPRNAHLVMLYYYSFIKSIIVDLVVHPTGKQYYYQLIAFLFIILNLLNLYGLIPYTFVLTSQFSFTFFCSFIFFAALNFTGITVHGLHLFGLFFPSGAPIFIAPLLVVIEFISYFARVFSLAIRLFANITAGHILLKILSWFTWSMLDVFFASILSIIIITVLWVLEFFISVLQAYVFTILVCIYLNDVLNLH